MYLLGLNNHKMLFTKNHRWQVILPSRPSFQSSSHPDAKHIVSTFNIVYSARSPNLVLLICNSSDLLWEFQRYFPVPFVATNNQISPTSMHSHCFCFSAASWQAVRSHLRMCKYGCAVSMSRCNAVSEMVRAGRAASVSLVSCWNTMYRRLYQPASSWSHRSGR